MCTVQTKHHSIIECASQCIDVCLKKCVDQQILCYTRCSDECNLSCMEISDTIIKKSEISSNIISDADPIDKLEPVDISDIDSI